MRAQAADSARAQNLAVDKMALQEKIEEGKIKSAEKIAEMNVSSRGKDDF